MNSINFKTLLDQELRELIASAKAELSSRQNSEPQKQIPRTLRDMYYEVLRDSTVTRYNGGWSKTVKGLDKSKTNGYSILGDFVDIDFPQYWKDGTIILDCDINGSRKHPEKTYRLFRYQDGKLHLLTYEGDTKDWAVRLWPTIEEALA